MAETKFYGFRWVLTDLSVKLAEAVKAVMGVGEVKVSAETNEVVFLAPLPDKRRQIDLRQLYSLMGQLVTDMTAMTAHPFPYPFYCTVKEVAPFIVEVIPDEELGEFGGAGEGTSAADSPTTVTLNDSPSEVRHFVAGDSGQGSEAL